MGSNVSVSSSIKVIDDLTNPETCSIDNFLSKSMSFISNGLTEIRDVEGFEDDFPLEEFNYFIETIPSHNSEGKFQDDANIPSKLISNAKGSFLKSRPNATKEELQKHLSYKFYGNGALFDEETSFLLNQCLRTGSECFNNAKKFVIQNGFNIKRNEFFKSSFTH